MSTNEAYIYELYSKLGNDNQPITIAFDIENIVLITDTVYSVESFLDIGKTSPLTSFNNSIL